MDYLQRYDIWCKEPLLTEDERASLIAMTAEDDRKGAFGAELQFGTAGIRGIMGLGTNRLNDYTVRRTAQGLAAWLVTTDLPKKCAIGYDSRHNSRRYAEICACALAEKGIHVYVYHELAPTPMLSYAVRQLNCGCGIVVSASHNAGAYNGIKCYGPDGCQMTDEPAAIVYNKISEIPYFVPAEADFASQLSAGAVEFIAPEMWTAYYDRVMEERIALEPSSNLNVLYTPLCGTGNKPVREIFRRIGANVDVVKVQEHPDGDFKTCEYPNPETDAALNESYKVAQNVPCDLILGTDPDADRVAIAVPNGNGFTKLSGNELGCLLMDYILKARTARGDLPMGSEVVRSIVSSPLADRIAASYNVDMKAVLTGFKYIGGEILRLEEKGEEKKFVFGFEESCGYLKGTYARDKDAIVASMLVCEMAAALKRDGKTVLDALDELYANHGYYLAHVQSVELTGADAMEKAAAMMASLRKDVPEAIGGAAVTMVNDYQSGVSRELTSGKETKIQLPKSNVLELILGEQGSVIARPSGTEPKVKFYYTAVGKTKADSKALLERMVAQMSE